MSTGHKSMRTGLPEIRFKSNMIIADNPNTVDCIQKIVIFDGHIALRSGDLIDYLDLLAHHLLQMLTAFIFFSKLSFYLHYQALCVHFFAQI